MGAIPGLRSPYAMVGRLVYFGRMLDKIRLNAAGKLPPEYCTNLGMQQPFFFDARTCQFLGADYEQIKARTLQGGSDTEVLAWVDAQCGRRSDGDCAVWNQFMMKVGWRDDRTGPLQRRVSAHGFAGKGVETAFDFLEIDEGRDPFASRPWELRPALCILIMGVAGSGKTTIGVKLAQSLGWSFRDADEFHPPENVAKMAAGIPLDDQDREPWLQAIRGYMEESLGHGRSTVVTCSALKESYRQTLLQTSGGGQSSAVKLVYLKGDFELILQRIGQRQGHFMKADMLRSQFEALERPAGALEVDVALSPEEIVAKIRAEFKV